MTDFVHYCHSGGIVPENPFRSLGVVITGSALAADSFAGSLFPFSSWAGITHERANLIPLAQRNIRRTIYQANGG
jgi:hypothetical protein